METLYKKDRLTIEEYDEGGSCCGSTGCSENIWKSTRRKALWIRIGSDIVVIKYEEKEDGVGSETKNRTTKILSIENPKITLTTGMTGTRG